MKRAPPDTPLGQDGPRWGDARLGLRAARDTLKVEMTRPETASQPLRWALLTSLGIAGVALGHSLGYWAAYPDPHVRAAVEAASGHGYRGLAVAIAAVGGIAALVGQTSLGVLRGGGVRDRARPGAVAVFLRLGILQLALFVALESGERLAAGAGAPWGEAVFWWGALIQVAVAWLGAVALSGAERLGSRLARRLAAPRRAGGARVLTGPAGHVRTLGWARVGPARAPPFVLRST